VPEVLAALQLLHDHLGRSLVLHNPTQKDNKTKKIR
jgi:hypothetical protein